MHCTILINLRLLLRYVRTDRDNADIDWITAGALVALSKFFMYLISNGPHIFFIYFRLGYMSLLLEEEKEEATYIHTYIMTAWWLY